MNFKVKFSKKANKYFADLQDSNKKRISKWIDNVLLKQNAPRDIGKALKGNLSDYWRYQIGDYRLICDIRDAELVILVITIGDRKDVYDSIEVSDDTMNIITEKLEIHDTLNKNIWNSDMTLRRDVELKLYDIIDEFVEDSNFLTHDDIITANIVGSNASYNYTDHSDLDLHIVIDFNSLSDDEKFVGYATDGERIIFNRRYDIDINGVNAEIYVEDIKSLPVSNGIYDLYNSKWIKKPIKLKAPEIDNNLYIKLYAEAERKARKLLADANASKDIQKFINQLYIDRRNSLAKDGESGIENQIFKDIRNSGLLDELKDKYYDLRSQELSLTDSDDTQLESILLQTSFGQKFM